MLAQIVMQSGESDFDPPSPATAQLVPQGLGFADAAERIALCFLDEAEETERLLAVALDPPGQVFKGRRVKFQASHGPRRAECLRCGLWPPASASSWPRS